MQRGKTQTILRFGNTCEMILSLTIVLRAWTLSLILFRSVDWQLILKQLIYYSVIAIFINYRKLSLAEFISKQLDASFFCVLLCYHHHLRSLMWTWTFSPSPAQPTNGMPWSMFCSKTCDSFWRFYRTGSQIRSSGSLFFSSQERYVLVFSRFFWIRMPFKIAISSSMWSFYLFYGSVSEASDSPVWGSFEVTNFVTCQYYFSLGDILSYYHAKHPKFWYSNQCYVAMHITFLYRVQLVF